MSLENLAFCVGRSAVQNNQTECGVSQSGGVCEFLFVFYVIECDQLQQ
jgi:hypothetical protein